MTKYTVAFTKPVIGHIGICLYLLILLASTWPAIAAKTDNEQPIDIKADRIEYNDSSGIAVYTGNVKMTQGTIKVTAETIEVMTKNDVVEKILVNGALANEGKNQRASFHQLTDDNQKITAYAKQIEYYEQKSLLILIGDAELIRDQDSIKGNKINYNTQTHNLEAGKKSSHSQSTPKNNKDRVHILIQPKKESTSK